MTIISNQNDFQRGEILLINKPLHWTSFDVVKKIRTLLNKKLGIRKIKVGHAGTLDPLATGLLILCTGKFTKKLNEFQALKKEYISTMVLGATTPSFDLETAIDKTFSINHITEQHIFDTTKKFIGTIEQVPPLFSATKIAGKRAYHRARQGEQVEMKSRKVTIYEYKIVKIDMPNIEFKVVCSKGTYIRSIASDFGKYLNSGAYLSALCRTQIGDYKLVNALTIEKFEQLIK